MSFPVGAEAVGSAFYVNADGILLTTWNEVRGCRSVAILVDYEFSPVRVVAGNPLSGLAFLGTSKPGAAHAVLRTDAASEGERISAFAHPVLDGISLPLEVSNGVVRSTTGPDGVAGILQSSAVSDDQSAGGPIVDRRGYVIGIIMPKLSAAWPDSVGYGIGASLILKFGSDTGVALAARGRDGGDASSQGPPTDADRYTVPVICSR